MNTGNNIQDELKNMDTILAGMPRVMPYVVPVDYFENFHNSVKEVIKDLNEPEVIPGWSKTLPYTVPQGYFKALHYELAEKIISENDSAGLPADVPYTAPAGYFESLPARVLQAAKASESKVIPLTRRTMPNPIKWLAAAILILGLGLGSYKVFFSQQNVSGSEKILASVPSNDIQDYLQHIYRMDINKVLQNNSLNNMNIDNKDIVQYLNETGWD